MRRTVNYIFEDSNSAFFIRKGVETVLKRQSDFNSTLTILALGVTAYITLNEINRKRQNEKIRELERKLKGEQKM